MTRGKNGRFTKRTALTWFKELPAVAKTVSVLGGAVITFFGVRAVISSYATESVHTKDKIEAVPIIQNDLTNIKDYLKRDSTRKFWREQRVDRKIDSLGNALMQEIKKIR